MSRNGPFALAVAVALAAAGGCARGTYAGWESSSSMVAPDYRRPRALAVVVVRPPDDERPLDAPMRALADALVEELRDSGIDARPAPDTPMPPYIRVVVRRGSDPLRPRGSTDLSPTEARAGIILTAPGVLRGVVLSGNVRGGGWTEENAPHAAREMAREIAALVVKDAAPGAGRR